MTALSCSCASATSFMKRWPGRWSASLAPAVLLVLLAFFLLHIRIPVSLAQASPHPVGTERSIKAAFIYKFLAYVEWPAEAVGEAGAPLTIGILNAADVATDLTRIIAGKTANNRPIKVRQLQDSDALTGIHLLFIGDATSDAQLSRVLKAAQRLPILTITESEDALMLGSIINFMIVDNRIRFDVSLQAAEKSRLKLSSRMLTVAHQVQKGAE